MSTPDPAVTDWVPLWSPGTLAPYVPACRVYRTADQSIPYAVNTPIQFTAERFDTDGIHDNVTNNTRMTCRTAGKYLLTANVAIASNATGLRQFAIQVNGANVAVEGRAVNGANDDAYMHTSTVVDLAVGDYVEVLVYQSSGGALNVFARGNYSPEAEMIYLGPGIPQGAFLPPSYGTSFPASPADGQEHVLVDSVSNPTWQWRFRFNASSTSAYKWEFVGGSEKVVYCTGSVSTASQYPTFVDHASAPTFTAPRAGDYAVGYSMGANSSVPGGNPMADVAAGAQTQDGYLIYAGSSGGGVMVTLSRPAVQITGVAAAAAIRVRFCNFGAVGTAGFERIWMSVRPVRVS